MNAKKTWLWLAVAAFLFAAIFVREKFGRKPETGPAKVFPGLRAVAITSVQVQPAGQRVICAERTNGVWRLTEPIDYPAQAASIEGLLGALQKLTPTLYLTPAELKNHPKASEEYGFDPPQASLILDQGGAQRRVWIGRRTAPGDEVYLQVVGMEGYYVVDAGLLRFVPRTADDWRDTTLADLGRLKFDRLDVTNAGKNLELQFNPANKFWRMVLPNETRADSNKVEEALQRLNDLRVHQFVADGTNTDLDTYGLQTPDLSLVFKEGTNSVIELDFGKSPTNDAHLVYARRADRNTVVTVPTRSIEPWLASYSQNFRAFMDRHLITLTAPPDEIEVRALDNFTLRRTSDTWRVEPQGATDFPADAAQVKALIDQLSGLEAVQIVKDVAVDQELPKYGLAAPARQFIFKAAATNAGTAPTNFIIAHLDFGTNDDKVFARRAGDGFVYSVEPTDYLRLPSASFQLRDRRIWKFTEDDVARVTIHENGKSLEVIRKGANSWSVAPGSQGIINDLALDEVMHRLGDLSASAWVERGDRDLAQYGFTTNSLQVAIVLKNGETKRVEFGGTSPLQYPYALTVLDGEPWIFEFPLAIFQYVETYLTIPPGLP